MVIIVIGPAGAGKTTVGAALAAELGWRFVDADDYHAPDSIAKMRGGTPLGEADRAGWLGRLRAIVEAAIDRREPLVLACSALKQRHREMLRRGLRGVRFVYLQAEADLLRRRLAARRGHFAGPALVASQLGELEPPDETALMVDAAADVRAIVGRIRAEFGLR
jgi:gluconokinase